MQTNLQTQSPPLASAWQSEVLVDDINASVKPGKAMTMASQIVPGTHRKAQALEYKYQTHMADLLSSQPQLVKPTTLTGADETDKLLMYMQGARDLPDVDYDLLQEKLTESFLPLLTATVLTKVDAGQRLLNYAEDSKESNPSDDEQLQTLTGHIRTFQEEPTHLNYASLLAAVIVGLAKMRVISIQTLTAIIGSDIALLRSSRNFQAKQVKEQGFTAMVGAAVQAAATVAMAATGYLVQKEGLLSRDKAFDTQTKLKGEELDLSQINQAKLTGQQDYYGKHNIKGRRLEEIKESAYKKEKKILEQIEAVKKEKTEARLAQKKMIEEERNALFSDEDEILKIKDKHQEAIALYDNKVVALQNEIKHIKSKANTEWGQEKKCLEQGEKTPVDVMELRNYSAENCSVGIRSRLEQYRQQIHELSKFADERQAMSMAILNGMFITQMGSAALNTLTKASESAAIISATDGDNMEKIIQMLLQYLQSKLSELESCINLITEILRSRNDASSVIASNSKLQA